MNTCLYCGKQIEEKTKSGKKRKYCNKSCSRKHYCENNSDALVETNKRGFQTLLQSSPEKMHMRQQATSDWWKTQQARDMVLRMQERNHYSLMNSKSSVAKKGVKKKPGQVKRWRETYKKNGYMLDNPAEWKQYNRKCRYMTRKRHGPAGRGFVWDHIVPISYGFKNNISPDKICSEENVRRVTGERNREKWMHLTEESYAILAKWSDDAYL